MVTLEAIFPALYSGDLIVSEQLKLITNLWAKKKKKPNPRGRGQEVESDEEVGFTGAALHQDGRAIINPGD